MPARAWATMRSPAATCSSSARTSGSSAFSRTSQLATATSASCRTNNASRSGCTLPPCRLEDLPSRTFGISFISQGSFLESQTDFLVFGGEVDLALYSNNFPRFPVSVDVVERPGTQMISGHPSQSCGLELFQSSGGYLVQSVGSIL